MNNLKFDYVPLTFINNKEEIKKQIRNTLILIHLFEKYNSPVRLEKLIEGTQYGYNASALQSGKNKFLRISDIHESKVNWETVPYCNCDDERNYLLKKDDILIARTGGTTGKSFKIENPPAHSIYAGYLIRIRANKEVNPDYLYLFLNSFAYWSQITNLNERNFRPKANAENLKSLILPDCLKSIQNDAVKISNGELVKGYEELYNKIEKVLSEYYKTEEVQGLLSDQLTQLENLNQAILQEAVLGKLAVQNPDDEPASELLKSIKEEKVLSGKKEKPLPPIKPQEIPFEIPENWVWCRLGGITNYGSSPKAEPTDLKNDTWVLDLEDIEKTTSRLLCKIRFNERNSLSTKSIFKSGDVLYSKLRPYLDKVIVADEDGVCTTEILPLKCYAELNPHYLKYALKSANFIRYVNSVTKGMKMPRLGTKEGQLALIPLPPLPEQKRIVAEIEKQFAKTKQLKEHIIANQQASEHLLKASLYQAFKLKEEKGKTVQQVKGKVVELDTNIVNWDNLVTEPFEKYAAHPANNIKDIDWEMAMMVACMKNKLGITYGDVGLQKNVYNTNNLQPIFSKQYAFANSNFGTYCHELKEDLKRNPYLIAQKVANNKEVYAVNPKYSKQVLDKLSAPENKEFIHAINRMLGIYEHGFINKETDKIELYNTVLKVALDKNTRDIDDIYQGMKDWKINQAKYKTKAEKFSKVNAKTMLKLLIENKIL